MSTTKAYVASLPKCDFCAELGKPAVDAHYDGKTKLGPWASMCDEHWTMFGIGLGTGVGQEYVVGEKPARDRHAEARAAAEAGDTEAFFDAVGDGDPLDYL
jgi:hypothetical protein